MYDYFPSFPPPFPPDSPVDLDRPLSLDHGSTECGVALPALPCRHRREDRTTTPQIPDPIATPPPRGSPRPRRIPKGKGYSLYIRPTCISTHVCARPTWRLGEGVLVCVAMGGGRGSRGCSSPDLNRYPEHSRARVVGSIPNPSFTPQTTLGIAPPEAALFYVICSPVGPYYAQPRRWRRAPSPGGGEGADRCLPRASCCGRAIVWRGGNPPSTPGEEIPEG